MNDPKVWIMTECPNCGTLLYGDTPVRQSALRYNVVHCSCHACGTAYAEPVRYAFYPDPRLL